MTPRTDAPAQDAARPHVHTLGRDGFYSCGCVDPHLSPDPDYVSDWRDDGEDDCSDGYGSPTATWGPF